MKTYRLAVAALATLITVACAKDNKAAADSAAAAAATATPAPPPPFSLADAAGKWQTRAVPVAGADTTATNYVVTATADTTGWMITYPSGLKVPLHVMVSGDSLMLKTGTYASQRRKGIKVMTEGVARLQGGKLIGMTTAHYQSGKDTVLHLRFEGTKQP